MKRKKVTWKADAVREVVTIPTMRKGTDDPLENKKISESLYVGSMWVVKKNLSSDNLNYLFPSGCGQFQIQKGTIAIFFGSERVDEMKKSGAICRVLRQVFLINGTKYMSNTIDKFFSPAGCH